MDPQSAAKIEGTLVTTETPYTPSDPNCYEYPFPDQQNQTLYASYSQATLAADDVIMCGRLGEYRYYDMDQAIGKAMKVADRILLTSGRQTWPVTASRAS